jgi:hypothetical protein
MQWDDFPLLEIITNTSNPIKSISTGTRKVEEGKLSVKSIKVYGTFDAVIRKLRVLLGGAYGKDKAVLMVQPILEKAEKAQEKKMTMPVFLEAVEYMMSDIAQRAKDYCTSSSPYPPEVGDWSEGFLVLWNAAILSSSLRGVIEGRLVPTLDPAWHSIEEEPMTFEGKGGGKTANPQQQQPSKKHLKKQQHEQKQWQQPWQPEDAGKGGGKGNGKGQDRGGGKGKGSDSLCSWVTEHKNAAGVLNHFMCPFLVKNGECRHLHPGLEDHSGAARTVATASQYEAIKKSCQENFPNWKPADVPSIPRGKWHDNRNRGKGKGEGKGKGKGWY